MIKNLWKKTHFYCSYRHEPVEMTINDKGDFSMFYSCPKYYPENRLENEQACPMRLNFVDAEAILNEISRMTDDESGFDCNGKKKKKKTFPKKKKKKNKKKKKKKQQKELT